MRGVTRVSATRVRIHTSGIWAGGWGLFFAVGKGAAAPLAPLPSRAARRAATLLFKGSSVLPAPSLSTVKATHTNNKLEHHSRAHRIPKRTHPLTRRVNPQARAKGHHTPHPSHRCARPPQSHHGGRQAHLGLQQEVRQHDAQRLGLNLSAPEQRRALPRERGREDERERALPPPAAKKKQNSTTPAPFD
jgi:hypothetical protein